jgi:2'-5' RNA ligase
MGTRWRGLLAPIDQATGDGRRMAPGAFTHRPLPLPLKWQRTDQDGHTTSVTIGSMETLSIDESGQGVWATGELFDDVSPSTMPRLAEDVAEAKLLLEKGVVGPSVDPGSAQAMTVIKGGDQPLSEQAMEAYWMRHGKLPETELLFTGYEIAAATLVAVPAFAQCRPFELLDGSGEPIGDREAIMAAAAGLPPLDPALFMNPNLATYTPYTERDLGNGWTHVFGHVAAHSTCHVGMRGVCTTAPYSDHEYVPFHRYSTTLVDRHPLPVMAGRLTGGFGHFENLCGCHRGNDDHACGNISFGAAIGHHDQMEPLAYVCVGEDEANDAIWFSGVRAPEISEDGKALLRRRKISGDWRDYGESMELAEVLVLARREPGFPLPRVSVENGRQRSLTAAGVIMPPLAVDTFTNEHPNGWGDSAITGGGLIPLPVEGHAIDYDRLGAAVAEHLMAAARGEAVTAAVRADWDGVPLADDGREWDKGAAVRRLVEWADGDISGRYARAFLWRDPDADPDLQGSYSLPIADVIDGTLTIVPNAVRNAAARLNQVSGLGPDDETRIRAVLDTLMGRIRGDEMAYGGDDCGDGQHRMPDGTCMDDDAMTAAAAHTGAMVALRMTEQDAARLAVTGGEPMDELHMTVAYLGDADQIPLEVRERIHEHARQLAASMGGPVRADASDLTFFNPGNTNGFDTALVLGLSGEGLTELHESFTGLDVGEDWRMPDQHTPYKPHVTLEYTDDMGRAAAVTDRMGPVTFDRLRLAFGGDVTDIPLGEIIEADEDEQEERDAEDAMYARTARANQLAAQIWFTADSALRDRAAELAQKISTAAAAVDE